MSSKIENELNVKELVSQKVEAFSSQKSGKPDGKSHEKEFKFIELIGALLGFAIGCVQLVLISIA